MPYLGEIAGLTCGLIWTIASFLWARVGGNLTALSINAFKSAVGFLIITLTTGLYLGSLWPTGLDFRQQAILLSSGVIGLGIGDAFYFMALLRMGARRALLMWLTTPAMSAILGWMYLGDDEAIGWMGWTGMALTMLGILAVQFERPDASGNPDKPITRKVILWGSLAGLVASLGQAVASLMTKFILNEGVHELSVVQVRLAATTVFLVAVGAVLGRLARWSRPFCGKRVLAHGLTAAFLGTAAGLSLMTLSQKLIPIGLSNTLTSTSPLFALPLAYFFMGSKVSFRAVVGTAIAFTGVAMVFLE